MIFLYISLLNPPPESLGSINSFPILLKQYAPAFETALTNSPNVPLAILTSAALISLSEPNICGLFPGVVPLNNNVGYD